MNRDSLIRAIDELIEERRHDDAVRAYLYSRHEVMPKLAPHCGAIELALELDGLDDMIESRAEELSARVPEDRRADEGDMRADQEREDEHEIGGIGA